MSTLDAAHDVSTVRQCFERLKNESSTLEKKELLTEFKNEKLFTDTLVFLLDPMITTGISKKKMDRMSTQDTSSDLQATEDFPALLEYIKVNNRGRDTDLLVVKQFIESLDDTADQEFVRQIISKELKIGVSAKTVNTVYSAGDGGDSIFEFSPMLAADFNKRQHKISEEFYITQKIDGIRCLAIKENEKTVKFYSRAGKEIQDLTELHREIAENEDIPVGQVLDGELLTAGHDGFSVGDTFRATQKIVRSDGEKRGVDFLVFDTLPLREFTTGLSSLPYADRRVVLDSLLHSGNETTDQRVSALPVLYHGTDATMIAVEAEKADDAGFEGMMVNTADGFYATKRTDALQKVKSFKTADLLCTGVAEGTGRHVGRLGAALVEYRGGTTYVGTGFSDIERETYLSDPEQIVGKVIEVKFFEETTDSSTGQPSLRFPVFVGVRDDKDEGDTNIDK